MNELQKLIFNAVLFSITALSASIYGFAFWRHVGMGLTPDLWDKLILLCSIISTLFYSLSLHSSYTLYRSRLSLGLDSPSLSSTIASLASKTTTGSPTPERVGRKSNDGEGGVGLGLGVWGRGVSPAARGGSPFRGEKMGV